MHLETLASGATGGRWLPSLPGFAGRAALGGLVRGNKVGRSGEQLLMVPKLSSSTRAAVQETAKAEPVEVAKLGRNDRFTEL